MASFPIANAALYAVAAVGIAAVGVVGWRATTGTPEPPRASPPVVAAPAAPMAQTTPPAGAQSAAIAAQAPIVTPPAPPKLQLPEFDVVRVEPTGAAVIAGRAPAQSQVALFAGERKLGETRADANGQFVIMPSPLSPGDHLLSLRASGPAGNVASEQTVAVSVTTRPGEKNVAALTAPDKPTVILSEPQRPQAVPGAAAPGIAIRTVEAGEEGAFFASGVAPAGAHVRLYLNNSFVANVQTAPDGKWGLKVERGMAPGHYEVRADMVDAASGSVLARAEVPFDYPAPAVAVRPAPPAPSTAAIPQPPPRPASAPARLPASVPALATTPAVQTTTAPTPPRTPPVVMPPPSQPTAASAPAVVATPPVQTGSTPAPPRPATTPATAAAIATAPPVQTSTPPAPGPIAAAPAPSPVAAPSGLAIVPEIHAVTVIRGDNLWRISRKVLGKGARYTQIYEANSSQIRDPHRIWPGQIFVAPRSQAN